MPARSPTEGRAVLITGPVGHRASRTSPCACSTAASRWSATTRRSSKRDGDRLLASPPPTIAGKLEIRGIGIVDMDNLTDMPVALIVELTSSDIQRLPDDSRERPILGVKLPLIAIDAMTASAPSKVALALDRMGLKF